MNKSQKHFLYGCSGVAVLAVLVATGYVHQQHKINDNVHVTHAEKVEADKYKNDGLRVSKSKMKADYDNNTPNLSRITGQNRDLIQRGVSLAFNDCHTESDIEHYKGKIISLLGTDLGDRVLNYVQPQTSGDTPFVSHYHAVSKVNNLISSHVSYGKLDDASNSLPVEIDVEFETPPYDEYAQDNAKGLKHRKVAHQGRAIYKGALALSDGTLQITHSYSSILSQG